LQRSSRTCTSYDAEGISGKPEEFFERVSQREGVDGPKAIYHARAIIAMLYEAVSPGEMADVRAQLPADYGRLFEPDREEAY
jgi:uncharacterized protein (DUF2267 family)